MSTPSPSDPPPPIVNVIKVSPADDTPNVQPSEANQAEPSQRRGERRLARGFTITVSAPPDEELLDDSSSFSHQGSWTSTGEDIGTRPRERSWERDHLAPEEFTPEVPLDRTESRLPSLEDMLADEEMKKMLGTSDIHREIQEAIVEEDDSTKYETLMSLVQKSYEDAEWRSQAAKDKNLIDTLVLFIRQRITEAQNPFQVAGGDFMGRSTRTLRSLNSRTLGRSNTQTSDAGSQSPGGSGFSRLTSLTDTEQIQRAAIALALAGPAVKLLRNFCVGGKECQVYLHEHRILDLLLDHIDLISEITYQAADGGGTEDSSSSYKISPVMIMIPNRRCPSWAASELLGFPRSLVQLVTNVVTGNPNIQAHILSHIFPEAVVKIIVLSGDADLLSCLLHCLTVQQSTSKVYDLLIADPRSVQIWYLLLSAALRQAEPALESIAYRRQTTAPIVQDSSQGEWLSLFISSILKREFENKSFFVELVNGLLASDVMSFRTIVPKLVLAHSAPSRSPSRSASHSRRSSYELTSEWQGHVHFQVDKVLVTAKQDVMLFLFTLIEALLDGELGQQPIKLDGLAGSLAKSTEVLSFFIHHFEASAEALEDPDLNDMEILTYRQSFIPLTQILTSLTAISCLLDKDSRQQFNQILGTPLLTQVVKLLTSCHQLTSTKDAKWDLLGPSLSRRDLLLIVANLCYQSRENQRQLATEKGIPTLLNHAHIEEEDPLMEQAAIFALRNACQNEENQQLLKQFLSGEFKRIRLTEQLHETESVVVGKFDTDDNQVVRIDEISSSGNRL